MSEKNIYEYMHNLPMAGGDTGVDAVTITATGLEGKLSIAYILDGLREYIENEKKKPFKFQSATGWSAGAVRTADKYDGRIKKLWSILMVTGPMSTNVLKASLAFSDVKYTRVDLCCDIVMSEKVLGLARKLKDSYKGSHAIKLIESNTGDTLYVGSRESETMVRIYDKSKEYQEEMGKVWRFEVEYKKGIANLVPGYLQEKGVESIKDMIFHECREKDLPSPIPGKVVTLGRKVITMSSSEMKLNWLSRQVAPTVQWLVALGYEKEVVEALQLRLPID